ncbi:MAG: type II toxin-antitoxin system VapC family toxin [Jatrophihabitans sp.]
MDCFDADALIYAAVPGHPLGRRVKAMFAISMASGTAGGGSLLLLPEILGKPLREGQQAEIEALLWFIARLELLPVDRATAELATALCARYRLRTADAVHLATAVIAGADRFITNNQRDFGKTINEVDIVYPADLPDPGA